MIWFGLWVQKLAIKLKKTPKKQLTIVTNIGGEVRLRDNLDLKPKTRSFVQKQ